jgi:peptide/nickel transport system substrate-binding protein
VSALLTGEIDVAHRILPDFVDQVEAEGMTIVSVPSGQSGNIFFQSSRPGPLQDVRVRQAIDYAIDKEALFEGITNGLGQYLDGQIVGPDSIGHNPDVHARPYDPDKARELLAEAGYADGVTLAFDYSVARYFRDKDMGEAISAYLEQVGITVEQNPLEAGAWLDRLYTGEWGPINYWSIQDTPAYDLSWTMEIFKTDNLRKLTADENIDRMLDESFQLTDTDERDAYLQEFAAYLAEQTHFVAFHQDPGIYGVNPRVTNIEFLPSTYFDLFDTQIVE